MNACIPYRGMCVYAVSNRTDLEDTMTRNEGTLDRTIRLIAALALGAAAYAIGLSSTFGIVLVVLAAIMLVTAATGFCPLYRVFGLNTCPRTGKAHDQVAAGR
jgi:Protein of unknown function (DUF2892)